MPILFVNGKRRGLRIRGRAKVNPSRRKARRNPSHKGFPWSSDGNNGLSWQASSRPGVTSKRRYSKAKLGLNYKKYGAVTKYGHMTRLTKRNPAKRKRRSTGQRADQAVRKRKKSVKRGRRARRSTSMARKRKKRQPEGLRRYQAARRKAGKWGRPGRTRKRRKGDKRHGSRRKARRVKRRSSAPKRRRARKSTAAPKRKRARRTKRRSSKRSSRRRSRRSSAPKRKRARRTKRRSVHSARTVRMGPPSRMMTSGGTLITNPSRRRRRKSSRRRHRRSSRRRGYSKRYSRRYRKNPGGFLIDLAKRALPVLAAFYGTRLFVSKIGPMLPGVASLGTLASPVVALATVIGVNWGSKKVSVLAKHKEALLLGSGIALAESLIQAFAPASVKSLVGMSDYIQMGDYIGIGATPINDSMTLSDYIAVGSDGVEEELGLEEELGVEEELGNDLLGGVAQGSLMTRVPTQSFLQPVPARSFTKMIPAAGGTYDNPGQLYGGIFSGGWSAR